MSAFSPSVLPEDWQILGFYLGLLLVAVGIAFWLRSKVNSLAFISKIPKNVRMTLSLTLGFISVAGLVAAILIFPRAIQ